MLIDDDESVRLVLAEQLRDLGAGVEDFPSGASAIKFARSSPDAIDFVLSDFAMPKLNGLETLLEIARIAPGTRRALMTGFANDSKLADNSEVAVIRKPIDLNKLSGAFARQA